MSNTDVLSLLSSLLLKMYFIIIYVLMKFYYRDKHTLKSIKYNRNKNVEMITYHFIQPLKIKDFSTAISCFTDLMSNKIYYKNMLLYVKIRSIRPRNCLCFYNICTRTHTLYTTCIMYN